MKFRKLEGFEAIRAMEPDTCLKEMNESISAKKSLKMTIKGTKKSSVECAMTDTLEDIIDEAGGIKEGEIKFVHVGSPLGVIVDSSKLGETLGSFVEKGVEFGDTEITVCGTNVCAVEYMRTLLAQLKEESCGRCVLCRMGLYQLELALNDATNGYGRPDDLKTIGDIAESMNLGAYCRFGKAAGALVLSFVESMATEIEDHTKRKKCAAMVCRKYLTYHILGSKCTGCGDCMDECDEDAITGKRGFIHMIDELDCTKCGKCMEACEDEAIVLAGAIKPKTPEKLTKVGMWKGK